MKDHDHDEETAGGIAAPEPAREHQQVWESLPWLANGTASAAQRRRAAAHLTACADCRREFEAQQRLQQAVARTAPHPDVDAEAGLQRLFERLDAPAMEPQPLPSRPARAARREASRLTLVLAVAVVVQAIGLGVLGSLQFARDDNAAAYRVLSQRPTPAQPRASLQVVPAASMTMAEWQQLLQRHRLHVVDGPNEAGSYALAPVDSATAKPVDAALAALRATPGVRLAEPIAAAP